MDLAWRANQGKSENDSRQFSARAGMSRDYRMNQRHFLRPSASLAYDQLLVDGYRESGSSADHKPVRAAPSRPIAFFQRRGRIFAST